MAPDSIEIVMGHEAELVRMFRQMRPGDREAFLERGRTIAAETPEAPWARWERERGAMA